MGHCIAQDAAGLQSPPSAPVDVVVDLAPPTPPVIESPGEGQVVATGLVSFRGIAEPQADVTVTANGVVVARCRATGTGEWECPVATALESGSYSAFAVASDVSGRVSDPGSARRFTIRIVSVDDPLGSIGAKFDVTDVSAWPNPFDVSASPTTLRVTAAVDAVSGLAGRSPNHEFDLQVRWILRDRSGSWVRDLVSTTVVGAGDRPPPHRIAVSTDVSWNATDQSGALVPLEQHYPYDLAVSIIRRYVGSGRGPACGRGEETLASLSGACVIDRLNVSSAGSIQPVDRSSPLYGQRPRYSPSGKIVFTLSEPDRKSVV